MILVGVVLYGRVKLDLTAINRPNKATAPAPLIATSKSASPGIATTYAYEFLYLWI